MRIKGDQGTARAMNRRLILNLLRREGPKSRAELAVSTGLSPATVTFVVADLLEAPDAGDLERELDRLRRLRLAVRELEGAEARRPAEELGDVQVRFGGREVLDDAVA